MLLRVSSITVLNHWRCTLAKLSMLIILLLANSFSPERTLAKESLISIGVRAIATPKLQQTSHEDRRAKHFFIIRESIFQ